MRWHHRMICAIWNRRGHSSRSAPTAAAKLGPIRAQHSPERSFSPSVQLKKSLHKSVYFIFEAPQKVLDVRTTRLDRPCRRASSVSASRMSIASRTTCRDDRDTPLRGSAGWRDSRPVICPTTQAKYFCRGGLTQFLKISTSGKSPEKCVPLSGISRFAGARRRLENRSQSRVRWPGAPPVNWIGTCATNG